MTIGQIQEYEVSFAQGKLTVMAVSEIKAIQTAREIIPKFYGDGPMNPVTAKLVEVNREGRSRKKRPVTKNVEATVNRRKETAPSE